MNREILFPVKKILCPSDLSEPSYTGVSAAAAIAKNQSSELIILHIVTPIYHGGAFGMPSSFNEQKYYEEMRGIATQNLEDYVQKNTPQEVNTRIMIVDGTASEAIVQTAEKEDVDLIVIATHGWTGWRRFVFGSVTEKVVRLSSIPVLTIPESLSDK
jgi:nucleotide-binding universal stress UspA family protein